jgi:thiamine kinase-like enzyme
MTVGESGSSVMEGRSILQPDMQSLCSGLSSVLGLCNAGELRILDRERNAYSSGSLSEIVTCRLADGHALRLLVKYAQYPDMAGYRQPAGEPFVVMPWSNVPYEAEVYRHVLEPLRLSTPNFYGTYREPGTGRLWLVLEYLENARALDELADDSHMSLASKWLGRFHTVSEHLASTIFPPFLKKIGEEYYLALASRALSYATRLDDSFSWLPSLCSRFPDFASSIATLHLTITHGDYYRNNILLCDGNIHPVDWEQAAIDYGEMDLACLTFRWPANITQQCKLEYQRSRWPEGSPEDFETVLSTSRLVLYLNEIRSLPGWRDRSEYLAFSQEMHSLGERLGLI